MKYTFLITFLLLILSNILAQTPTLWTNTDGMEIDFSQTHKDNFEKIEALIDRIEGTTNLAIKNIESGPENLDQVKLVLETILSQTSDFTTKLDLYKNEIEGTKSQKLNTLKIEVDKLLKELTRRSTVINELNNQKSEKIAEAIIDYIQDVKELSAELTKKEEELIKKQKEIDTKDEALQKLQVKYDNLEDERDSLGIELKIKETELRYLTSGPFKLGLSAGLNYQFSGTTQFIVEPDSSARKIEGVGWQGLVSAVLIFHPDSLFNKDNKIDFILNVPIAEIGFGENQTFSTIFNKPIALGLGLGYQLSSNFSFFGIVNVGSDNIIDDQTLENRKFTEETFTLLDKENYSTTSKATFSLSFGFLYKFGTGNN